MFTILFSFFSRNIFFDTAFFLNCSLLRLENYEFSKFLLRGRLHQPEDTNNVFDLAYFRNYVSQKRFLCRQEFWERFILINLLIVHVDFGSSQPLVSLKITTAVCLIRETWGSDQTNLLKKALTYSSTF